MKKFFVKLRFRLMIAIFKVWKLMVFNRNNYAYTFTTILTNQTEAIVFNSFAHITDLDWHIIHIHDHETIKEDTIVAEWIGDRMHLWLLKFHDYDLRTIVNHESCEDFKEIQLYEIEDYLPSA